MDTVMTESFLMALFSVCCGRHPVHRQRQAAQSIMVSLLFIFSKKALRCKPEWHNVQVFYRDGDEGQMSQLARMKPQSHGDGVDPDDGTMHRMPPSQAPFRSIQCCARSRVPASHPNISLYPFHASQAPDAVFEHAAAHVKPTVPHNNSMTGSKAGHLQSHHDGLELNGTMLAARKAARTCRNSRIVSRNRQSRP